MNVRSTAIVIAAVGLAFGASPAYADFGDGGDCGTIPQSCPPPRASAMNRALNAQKDSVLAGQMQQVASYIEMWCRRNSRFPEPGDQINAVQADLTALLQNNPYTPQDVRTPVGSTLQTVKDPNGGSQMYGAPAYDYDIDVQVAQQINRVRISRDDSLTPNTVEYYKGHAQEWEAPAGTITIVGSNNGMVMVWGAGANGRPVMDPGSGGPLMIAGQWGVDNQDSNSPNEDI
jgi:hypothetical protein